MHTHTFAYIIDNICTFDLYFYLKNCIIKHFVMKVMSVFVCKW